MASRGYIPAGPIFVLGYGRSGTTLLRAVLGAHPQIAMVNEPELIQAIEEAGLTSARVGIEDRLSALLDLARTRLTRKHLETLGHEVLERYITAPEELTSKELYELLLPKPDSPVWGEKSLGNVFYLEEVSALYPRAVFVHVERDPHAAIISRFRKNCAGSAPISPQCEPKTIAYFARAAMLWSGSIRALEQGRQLLGCGLIELSYFDFIIEPERELRRVCKAAALAFMSEMLDPTRRETDPVLDSAGAFAHRRLRDHIDPARVDAGADLPGWAAYVLNRYAGADMRRRGFAPRDGQLSRTERETVDNELARAEHDVRAKLVRKLPRLRRVLEPPATGAP